MAQNKDIILLDTDGTKLYPLAHKDSSKNVIDTTYLKKAGGTMTGPLVINGYAGNNPLMVRGINGSDGEGNLGDLYLNYAGGITYFGTSGGGNISADGKSYSGNAATATKATKDGDGNTISTTYVKEAGDTMTGSLSFSNANIGVQRVGRSQSWHKGRDGALLKVTTLNGYSPTTSTKTTNGSWEIGAYDDSGYTDDLVFSYVKDSDYTNNTNKHVEIKFLENGTIVGNLSGNVTGSSSLNVLKAGDTMSGNLFFANTNNTTTTGSTPLGIYGSVGDNDGWRIVGLGGSNAGSLEIATDDDGNEPIYVRQYSGGGSSAGFVTVARTLTLLDGNGNTTIPGSLNLSSTVDAAGGTAGSPPLIIGAPTGQHLELDSNEILSKSNGTTPSILYLQDSTGTVEVAGSGGLNVVNGSIWAGTDGNTAAERDLGVQSGAGRIYLYSAAATNGARGIWLSAHGTDTSGKHVLSVDTNNNTTFYGTLSGNASTASGVIDAGNSSKTITMQYSGNGASSATWFGVWDGYKLTSMNAANMRASLAVPNMVTESYPALLEPGGSNGWIKVGKANDSYGLLPSQAGGAGSGHNYLGTSSWYWKYAYIDNIYGTLNGAADYPTGFSSRGTSQGWGNQTGTHLTSWNDGASGVVAWRKNNPATGQLSMVIDGTVYIQEGNHQVEGYKTLYTTKITGGHTASIPEMANYSLLRIFARCYAKTLVFYIDLTTALNTQVSGYSYGGGMVSPEVTGGLATGSNYQVELILCDVRVSTDKKTLYNYYMGFWNHGSKSSAPTLSDLWFRNRNESGSGGYDTSPSDAKDYYYIFRVDGIK